MSEHAQARPSRGRWLIETWAPVFLTLLAPFAGFLSFNRYGYWRPEVGLCVIGIAMASVVLGLIGAIGQRTRLLVLAFAATLFVDFQVTRDFWFHGFGKYHLLGLTFCLLSLTIWVIRTHAHRIVIAVMTTVLVSTVLVRNPAPISPGVTPGDHHPPDLPLVVQIVLDEHIGLDGLLPEYQKLRDDLKATYESLGFEISAGTYSEYARTEWSLSHMLNLQVGSLSPMLIRRDRPGFNYALARNDYFAALNRLGYRPSIVQTDYIEICREAEFSACVTQPAAEISVVQQLPWTPTQKARLVMGTFMYISATSVLTQRGYRAARRALARRGLRLPAWSWFVRAVPVNGMAAMNTLIGQLRDAKRGEFYFAHIMLTHAPFVFDRNCAFVGSAGGGNPTAALDPVQERRAFYQGYDGQVRCAAKMVEAAVNAVPEDVRRDAVFVVHGDHGSRLSLGRSDTRDASTLSPHDYRDIYSTLFAVRGPKLRAVNDQQHLPMSCLIRTLLDHHYQTLEGSEACGNSPGVYLTGPGGPPVRVGIDPLDLSAHPR